MELAIPIFMSLFSIFGIRAAPYLDAYGNMENSEFLMANYTNDDEDLTSPIPSKLPKETKTLTLYKEIDLFLYLPSDETFCYIKILDEDDDDTGNRTRLQEEDSGNCTKYSIEYKPVPDQIKMALPETCKTRTIQWLDWFFCLNNISLDSPDVIKALQGYAGPKQFCAYKAKTVHSQKCFCLSKGLEWVKNKSVVCLRTVLHTSTVKCKKEVTSYQSEELIYLDDPKEDGLTYTQLT